MPSPKRIHVYTTTPDETPFTDALRDWLHNEGYTLTLGSELPLRAKIDAARTCDCCILLINATFGQRDPLSSFADNELEAAAASDSQPGKLFIFALPGVDAPTSAEQQECIARWRNFTGGTFQTQSHTPADLVAQVQLSLASWQPPASRAAVAPMPVPASAVMISSTGDLLAEREAMRGVLLARNLPVIDYLHASSEAATPIDRVTSWARECHALFLILGPRYGYISPADGLGVTELEFVTAWRAGRPIIVFQRADAAATADPDQQQFIARVQTLIPAAQIHLFADASALAHLTQQMLNVPLPLPAPPVAIALPIAQKWYRRQVQRWLGVLPHLTQPAGMPLTHVDFSLQPGQPGTATGAAFAAQREDITQTLAPDGVLERWSRFVLRGNPGAGKSTIMRWYAINAPAQVVPIYLRLAAYARARQAGQVASIFAAMLAEEQRLALASPGDSLWRTEVLAGRAVILLDGLDEVPHVMGATVAADILQLAQDVPEATRIVVSTRIAGYSGQLEPTFPPIDVLPLNSVQQQSLVTQWVGAAHPTEDGEARRTRAQSILSMSAQLGEWTRTPLLLTLFAALADTPHADIFLRAITPAEIYRRGLRLLLGRQRTWEQKARNWHLWAKEQLLLGLVQRGTLGNHGALFTSADVRAAWEDRAIASADPIKPDILVQELVEGDGVLLRLAEDQLTFIHPTFQEYLAASLISVLPMAERRALVARHRLSSAWDETLPLLASELDRVGRQAEADDVVQTLTQGDATLIPAAGIPDPLHLALQQATRCQASRSLRKAGDATGERLVGLWRQIWADTAAQAHSGKDIYDQNGLPSYEVWGYLRERAMLALAQLGPAAASALPELTSTLNLPPSHIRTYAEQAIRYLADNGVVEAQTLMPRLAELQQREAALRMSQQTDATIPELQQALRSGDASVQGIALTRLGRYGSSAAVALPDILPLVHSPTFQVRTVACQTVAKLEAAAVPVWRDLFGAALQDASLTYSVIGPLGKLSAYTPEIASEMTRQLAAPDAKVRALAGAVLCNCGAAAAPAVPQLLQAALSDPDQNVRTIIVINMKNLKGLVVPHLTILHMALHSPHMEVKTNAIHIASHLGALAAPLVDDLRALLPPPQPQRTPDLSVILRPSVAKALGEIGPAAIAALPQLQWALNEPTPMREAALEAIGGLGPQAAAALPQARGILAQAWRDLNAAGGLAAGQKKDTGLYLPPITLLNATLHMLTKLGAAAAPAVPDIRVILQAPVPVAENEAGYLVWSRACTALRQIGAGAVSAIPELLRVAQQSPRYEVRFSALYALKQIEAGLDDIGPVLT